MPERVKERVARSAGSCVWPIAIRWVAWLLIRRLVWLAVCLCLPRTIGRDHVTTGWERRLKSAGGSHRPAQQRPVAADHNLVVRKGPRAHRRW